MSVACASASKTCLIVVRTQWMFMFMLCYVFIIIIISYTCIWRVVHAWKRIETCEHESKCMREHAKDRACERKDIVNKCAGWLHERWNMLYADIHDAPRASTHTRERVRNPPSCSKWTLWLLFLIKTAFKTTRRAWLKTNGPMVIHLPI